MKQEGGNCSRSLGAKQANYLSEISDQQWQVAVEMLKLMQNDYSRAKKQLEEVYRSFDEREKWMGERLHSLSETGSQTPLATRRTLTREESKSQELLPPLPVVSLRAYCFGSFEVYLNWNKIEHWHSLKAKSLLKFLVSRRDKFIAKDILIETLWPDCDPDVGRNNLKAAVYALRQTLSPKEQDSKVQPIILFSERHYLINPKLEVWVDVNQFEHHWLVGRAFEKSGKTEEAIREYCLAEELYRGDYLEDDPYSDWTLITREALKDTYLTILGKLANNSFQVTDYESCIVYSQKILAKDICHEEAYRWLIACYSRLGQNHRAHQWYETCVTVLKRELDADPDPKTIALYHQLLGHDRM